MVKCGKIVTIDFQGESKARDNSGATIFTIPDDLLPINSVFTPCVVDGGSAVVPGIVMISKGAKIAKITALNSSATGRVCFTVSYPIA